MPRSTSPARVSVGARADHRHTASGAGRGLAPRAFADHKSFRSIAMNENRRQILEMLAAGKITADEAERLMAALDPEGAAASAGGSSSSGNGTGAKSGGTKANPKYLRVLVEADES